MEKLHAIMRIVIAVPRTVPYRLPSAQYPCARKPAENGVVYSGNFWSWQRSPSEGTNCLFISKDHARPEADRIYVIFMACNSSFVLGSLKRKSRFGRFPCTRVAT